MSRRQKYAGLASWVILIFVAWSPVSGLSDSEPVYRDSFNFGTPAENLYYSWASSASAAWNVRFGRLRNENAGASNTEVFKAFQSIELAQPGDWIELRWGYRNIATSSMQGEMQAGLFDLEELFLADRVGGDHPLNNRRGVEMVHPHAGASTQFRYFRGANLDQEALPDPATGSALSPTAMLAGPGLSGVFPCTMRVSKTSTGLVVNGSVAGVPIPSRVLPGASTIRFNAIRFRATYSGSASANHSIIEEVELLVPSHLVPAPLWGVYDWSQAAEIAPGVRLASLSLSQPRLVALNVAQVDLTNPNLRFHTTPRASNYVQGTRETTSRTTRTYLSAFRTATRPLILAMNGDFFSPWPNSAGANTVMRSLAVSDGVVVSPPVADRPAFVFYKDWTADIITPVAGMDTNRVLQAMGGNEWVLDGFTPRGSNMSFEPRTGIGLSLNRRFVYFFTVDGRRAGHSDGMTIPEVGEFLRYFGAGYGLNLDGGGSTTMARWNTSTGQPQLLNIPSDQNTVFGIPVGGSVERTVGNHIGIYQITQPEAIPMDDWLAARGVPPNQRDPLDDPAGDGVPNLLAYAFNIHPIHPRGAFNSEAMPIWVPDGSELTYTFRVNRHATGIRILLERSNNLRLWSVLPTSEIETLNTPDPNTGDTYYRKRVLPGSGGQTSEFLRLRVEKN